MKTPRRAVELELREWTVEHAGFTRAPYLVQFELVWPRPGIESVRSHLPLPDRMGEIVDWSDAELIKKWMFKEDMEGRMILTADVRSVQDPDQFDTEEPLDLIGRSVARETSLTWGTLSDLLELGQEAYQYIVSGPRGSIARGRVLVESQEDQILRIPLQAPRQIRNPRPDPTPEDHSPRDDHQEVLAEAGDSNGYMEVDMVVWDE